MRLRAGEFMRYARAMRSLYVMALMWGLIALAGCEKDHERVMTQTTARMKEALAVLQTVKDEATAKAAAPKLQGVAEDLKRLQQEMNHLGEADKKLKQRLSDTQGKEFIDTSRQIAAEIERVRKLPEASAALDAALRQMNWEKLSK